MSNHLFWSSNCADIVRYPSAFTGFQMKKLVPSLIFVLAICVHSQSERAGPGPSIFAPGIVSTEFQETTASFTPDGKTVYFTRSDVQENDNTILESHLINRRWSTPVVASFSGIWRDSEPDVSPDGKRLFFISNRPVKGNRPIMTTLGTYTFNGSNVWYVEQRGNDWGQPIHLPGAINDIARLYNPSIARSGTLYFSAVLPDGGGRNQIYRSVPGNGVYGRPERLSFSDPNFNHMDPTVDPEERFIIFAANLPGSLAGSADLYISLHKDGRWEEPISLGENVNSTALENAPVLHPDGHTLYFSSARPNVGVFPKPRKETFADVTARLHRILNGQRNIWFIDIKDQLRKYGIAEK